MMMQAEKNGVTELFEKNAWRIIITDEAHTIKNAAAQRSKSMYLVSGSRKLDESDIQNDLGYEDPRSRFLGMETGSLESSFRLCMSGTFYINRIEDLESQAIYLGVGEYSTHEWWSEFGRECPEFRKWLKDFVIALRSEEVDYLLGLPGITKQTEKIILTGKSLVSFNLVW